MNAMHHAENRGCPLPKDAALALAVLPASMAKELGKLIRKLHWQLEIHPVLASAVAQASSRKADILFCAQKDWRDAVEAMSKHPNPPLLLVLAEKPDDQEWLEVLTAGAFYLSAKPFRMSELLLFMNHAWCNRHRDRTS